MTDLLLTAEQIAELKAKLSEATPGPWRTQNIPQYGALPEFIYKAHGMNSQIARCMSPTRPDAAAIVALVNAAPQLLVAAERVEMAEGAYREVRDQCTDAMRDANNAEEKVAELEKQLAEAEERHAGELHDMKDDLERQLAERAAALKGAEELSGMRCELLLTAEAARDAALAKLAETSQDCDRLQRWLLDSDQSWYDKLQAVEAERDATLAKLAAAKALCDDVIEELLHKTGENRFKERRSELDGPASVDPRPVCFHCGKRWTPEEGVDATVCPCPACDSPTEPT